MGYENLLNECTKLGIKVKEVVLKSADGRCKGNRLVINKNLSTQTEKKCVLAEELGHYHTTYGDIIDQNKIENIKQEIIARRWDHERLVCIVDIINAYRLDIRNKHELAEFLDVTEEFLYEAIQYYKCKHSLYYKIDNYLIYFEPLCVMELF